MYSATPPIPHSLDTSITLPFSIPDLSSKSSKPRMQRQESTEVFELDSNQPQLFTN